jgi:hypothetical protein
MRRRLAAGTGLLLALGLVGPSRAAMSVYVSPEDLAAISPIVVEGTVVRTASGYDRETRALATYVTLQVSSVLRGPASLETIVLREPGGRHGNVVHEIDAVPVYLPGERVLVFAEPSPRDGALRTAGMFFGKYSIRDGTTRDSDRALRDLSGQGWIGRRPDPEMEDVPLRDLLSAVAQNPYRARDASGSPPARRSGRQARRDDAPPPLVTAPLEMDRLAWDDVRESPLAAPAASGAAGAVTLGSAPAPGSSTPGFAPLAPAAPTRWDQSDTGTAVVVNVQQSGNPLNDGASAVTQMTRAMTAWTAVPEARLVLSPGNTNYSFTSSNVMSPADAQPPVNIVLFGDPYGDITDPVGCSGTLAIGGYWRSGTISKTVNGVAYYPATRLYLIFNNAFGCFLGDPDNLAEVGTHELGHGIGFGHSAVADAVMRANAYGSARGPRLGDDDRDAAHCVYPHTLTVTSPNGGESWQASSVHSITWTATSEAGGDPGTVSLELSTNAGSSWSAIASGEPNDGSYAWTVPNSPGSQTRVRVVRPNRVSPTPAPYPQACTVDASNASFTLTAPPVAGTSPDGSTGTPVRIAKAGAALTITWGASCSGQATNYAVYEGNLSMLRSGMWDQLPVSCSAGTDLAETFAPNPGNRYYLVAPLAGGSEGSLGRGSSGIERPASPSACAPREASSCP